MAAKRWTDADRAHFLVVLAEHEGDVSKAAAVVGVPRSTGRMWARKAERVGLAARTEHSRASDPQPDTSWHDAFLAALSTTANATLAAKTAGVGRTTAYMHRAADPQFAALWQEAESIADDAVVAEARRRAVEGVQEPVFYKGDICGHIVKYSDTMLTILLRHAHGGEYRERQEREVKQVGPVEVVVRREDRPIRASD